GTDKGLDKIITVVSPVEMRIARVMKREGWSREEVERRINNQWSDDEKIKRSDFVLYNDGNRMLTPQILELHNKLISLN
ncbi:MAG: dephospho-CoA kinase, partial [Bacteroidia bacterium]|nr:dephospho-CoA kinase [Bacteroidia bacterium]